MGCVMRESTWYFSCYQVLFYLLSDAVISGRLLVLDRSRYPESFHYFKNMVEFVVFLENLLEKREKIMKFIEKILDAFKMESTREMERNADRHDIQTNILYHEKFDEEYREIDNYREIRFTGKRNLDIPEVQLCAAILLDGSVNGSIIRENDHYSLYFEGRYGVVNISRLHKWLYEQGYLRAAVLPEALSLYKVPELKMILESLGLKKTGNKPDLIDRVINAIDEGQKTRIMNQCEYLFVTEKGYAFLEENKDYVMYHRKSYGVTFQEFNEHRILCGRKREFHDTIFNVLSQKAAEYQVKGYFSRLEMIYFNLSETLYDEGRYDLALQNTLFRVYFSTNLASHPYYFDINLVKLNGVKKMKEHIIACNDVFYKNDLDRIVELKEYYNEHLLDIVYGYQILPYCIFDETDMEDMIYDLLNEVYFDTSHYMNYICARYENYIKRFL